MRRFSLIYSDGNILLLFKKITLQLQTNNKDPENCKIFRLNFEVTFSELCKYELL